jgi:hypothetical protein
MTCVGVYRVMWPHWQLWGTGAQGWWRVLYSPVNACSVSKLMAIQKTGLEAVEIPCMNLGGSLDGGWWRAR